MRWLVIFLVVLLTGGCATSPAVQTIRDKYHVIIAPSSMYNCPRVKVFPKIETLTDLETAKLLVKYAENNAICSSSVQALKNFYEDAKRKFES